MKRTGRVIEVCLANPIVRENNINGSATRHSESEIQLGTSERQAWVEVDGLSACDRCAKGHGCGSVVYHAPTAAVRLRCQSVFPVQPSQRVTIAIDDADSSWLWLVMSAYGLPLAGLITGVLLGEQFYALFVEPEIVGAVVPGIVDATEMRSSAIMNEFLAAAGGGFGLVGGLIAWRHVSRTIAERVQRGLCLHTARIVAVNARSLETEG